jgi:hypothetical protein
VQSIKIALEGNDNLPGLEKQTVLITVMKNGKHLDNLIAILRRLDLASVPALVIDDEADQASLNNNVNKGSESATYQRMVSLRKLQPLHTFLQYTATPQAILLINLIDVLSPIFAEVLTPGPSYTGGHVFFEGDMTLVHRIPAADIPTAGQQLTDPPDSLLQAMRIFFLGVAAGLYSGATGNRSMMDAPPSRTMQHTDYIGRVHQVMQTWEDIITAGDSDPDYRDLMEEFEAAYVDLCNMVEDIPPYEKLIPYLKEAIRRTVPIEVNAACGKTPQPEWKQVYSYIVVGGDVFNRGYTVEGLSVTYMPRSLGTRQADTIQQRARWFGYKSDCLGYCRVYLPVDVLQAYRGYVEHENHLRNQMREHRFADDSLRSWRRAFFLDPQLRPTRASVIDLQYLRGSFSNEWYWPKAPHESAGAADANRGLVKQFIDQFAGDIHPDEGHPRRMDHKDMAWSAEPVCGRSTRNS